MFRGVQAWSETSISGLIRDLGCHLCLWITLRIFSVVFRNLRKLFSSSKIKDFFTKWTKKYFSYFAIQTSHTTHTTRYLPSIQSIQERISKICHFSTETLIFLLKNNFWRSLKCSKKSLRIILDQRWHQRSRMRPEIEVSDHTWTSL